MRKHILIIGDIAIFYLSLLITLLLRYQAGFDLAIWEAHLVPFSVILVILLVVFYIDELYELTSGSGWVTLLNRLTRSLAISGLAGMAFFYIASGRLFAIRPQTVFLIYLIVSGILIYFWRIGFNRLARSPKIARGIAIVGFNALAQEIIDELNQKPEFGLQIKTIVLHNPVERELVPSHLQHLVSHQGINELKSICLAHDIALITSVVHPRENAELLKNLLECIPLKINFADITNLYEQITGKIPVTKIEQIWFLENLTESQKKLYDRLKRTTDIMLSIVILLITLPLFPFIATVIKLSSRGPIFFVQTRTGQESKKFTAIKFRTMVHDAERAGPQWATKNDSRITRVGKFLRETRIDELPQLFNVLRGELSLIGPRPERPEFVEQLQQEIPFYKERLLVKPGLTGWAQVVGPAYGGSKEESLEKLQYDLFYIKNRSFGLDISILLKTIRTVLSRKGQ